MELQYIEIQNFRGVKEDYTFELDGGNAIVVGPNGSGKSSVLEAINYLLTNNIRQLDRDGMGSVKKSDVIPHVNGEGDCLVRGTFQDGDSDTPVEVQRGIDSPKLDPSKEDLPDSLQQTIDIALQGQHILTREDLLDLIIAQPKSRRDVLSKLLNLPDIDKRRLALKRTRDKLQEERDGAKATRKNTRDRLEELADSDAIDRSGLEGDVLASINELRTSFDGQPVDEIHPDSVREELESPVETLSAQALQRERPQEELQEFVEWLERFEGETPDDLGQLETLLADYKQRETKDVSAQQLELLELGEDVVAPETDHCPLCQQSWVEERDLQDDIRRRRKELRELQQLIKDVEDLQDRIRKSIDNGLSYLGYLTKELEEDVYSEVEQLDEFEHELEELQDGLRGDLLNETEFDSKELPLIAFADDEITTETESIDRALNSLESRTEDLEDLSAAEQRYGRIKSIAERWEEFANLDDEVDKLQLLIDDIETARSAFIEAREDVIGTIYDDITNRVESYYSAIHPDESGTKTSIEVTNTGAEIRKQFYDVGEFPPHSVFSEGHLDTLGLCLYLALADYLQHEEKSLLLLDDVVMSVDQDHRLEIARMIADEFAEDYQVIITTHDELWAEQLRSQGVLNGGNEVWLDEWTLDRGVTESRIGIDVDRQWAKVESAMADGEMQRAAHELRYATEKLLEEATISLNAAIEYDQRQRYTLEDYKKAVCRALRELTTEAKNSLAQTGDDAEHFESANELDNTYGETLQDVSNHLTKVNRRVHWTPGKWLTISPEEFKEVYDLHKEAYNLLYCEECGSSIRYLNFDDDYHELRCNCREHYDIQWN